MPSVFLGKLASGRVHFTVRCIEQAAKNRKYINLGHSNIIGLANEFEWADTYPVCQHP